jgi:hypothetical protein
MWRGRSAARQNHEVGAYSGTVERRVEKQNDAGGKGGPIGADRIMSR